MKPLTVVRRYKLCNKLYDHLHKKCLHISSRQRFLYDKLFEKSKMSGAYKRVTVQLKKEGMTEFASADFTQKSKMSSAYERVTVQLKKEGMTEFVSADFTQKSKMSVSYERVTVQLKKEGMAEFVLADFTQSIVDFIDEKTNNDITDVSAELKDNRLCISTPGKGANSIKIKRPPFCPIHNMSASQRDSLPQETKTRGIDCGAAVLLESGDGKILLTRRGNHLRTFPGIWVPPGGHIEQNETLTEAGLRELNEETGLHVTSDMCCGSGVKVIAMWESVFPPKLTLGMPKRHHAVIYLHAKLKSDITSEMLNHKINIDPKEVGAAAWFNHEQIQAITSVKEGQTNSVYSDEVKKLATSTFRAIVLNDDEEQIVSDLLFSDLFKVSGEDKDQFGRVSTGTKFALEEWLNLDIR